MNGPETVEALKRCAMKAAEAKDGRKSAGAVREARNTLQHLGHSAADALQMAEAARRVGEGIGLHLHRSLQAVAR